MGRKWMLRDIVVAVILSAVFGALYMVWDSVTAPLWAPAMSPVVSGLTNGFWWMGAGLVSYIIRRPGAAFFTELVASLFEFLFGSPYSIGAIVSGLVQGGGQELGNAIGGYRRYGFGTMMLAGALGGVGNFVQWLTQYQGYQYHFGIIVGYLITTMISGAVFAGILPKLIGDALKQTGVLRNFAIAKQSKAQG